MAILDGIRREMTSSTLLLIAYRKSTISLADQVVFLDQYHDDAIEELGGMNVFFVHADGRLVTPELTGTILEGVTRSSILQLGRDMGLTVEELADFMVFLCSPRASYAVGGTYFYDGGMLRSI